MSHSAAALIFTSHYLLNLPLAMMRIMSRMLATIPSTARLRRMVASDSGSSLQLISQLRFLLDPLAAWRLYWSRVDLIPGRMTVFLWGSMLVGCRDAAGIFTGKLSEGQNNGLDINQIKGIKEIHSKRDVKWWCSRFSPVEDLSCIEYEMVTLAQSLLFSRFDMPAPAIPLSWANWQDN